MFDQPHKLHLGSAFDRDNPNDIGERVAINVRDLTTHAICLGMTGTGKTGLGIVALEEVLLQDVPCIIIDPKGDITNLALNFPDLAPERFEPWLDAEEARRSGMTLRQLAEQTSARWRDGLQASAVPPERLQRLAERVKFEIYTPGSDAGVPVNVLASFDPPRDSAITWARHTETLRDRISQLVSALLALAGIDADPMKSREHILLATIFESTWRAGQALPLDALIHMIQQPPVARIGAFDMDVFYPKDERFELAMAINNLAASPSFQAWMSGQALDIAQLVTPDRSASGANPMGRTRASIFYLAHLDDAERQFFVTLLLSQLVMWMRAQSGVPHLRCLVYFDEVHGYCPPFPRNPPTKAPLMSIIKQGRAAGLGLFLATQNPADLDYKGLSNIGAWFIGRLRTGRDRDRALEGLEGAGAGFDREHFEGVLGTLPPRVFLLQSANADPRLFRTRWAMSFLRGPLTRDQLMTLTDGDPRRMPAAVPSERIETPNGAAAADPESPTRAASLASIPVQPAAFSGQRPSLPPDVREVFVPRHSSTPAERYRPYLLASAMLRITDRSSGVMQDERHTYLIPLDAHALAPAFRPENRVDLELARLVGSPEPGLGFDALPGGITARWMKQAERAAVEHLYRHGGKTVYLNRALKLYSQLGEAQIEFRRRCEDAARERRDTEGAKVRAQFERRMKALQDKLAREHRELSQDQSELSARKREELLAGVESVFNFVIGRRTPYAVAYGARRRRETEGAQEDLRETKRAIAQLNSNLDEVAAEYRTALSEVSDKWVRVLGDVQEVALAPKKSDIFVDLMAIAWMPVV